MGLEAGGHVAHSLVRLVCSRGQLPGGATAVNNPDTGESGRRRPSGVSCRVPRSGREDTR
jgi:hypothetical protein